MLDALLETAYKEARSHYEGGVARYIPALAQANPREFGLVLTPIPGEPVAMGDVDVAFTIQSMSKPFTFALALETTGPENTFRHVAVEPSGEAFNAIRLTDDGLPFNPMVNAGAISMVGVVRSKFGADAFDYVSERFAAMAGSPLGFDDVVYTSELETAHRNRAIAWLMCSTGAVSEPVDELVDLYTRICAMTVTTRQLGNMAATIANSGFCPRSGEMVIDPLNVRHVMSLMASCGMYDFSGRWMRDVGIPAKSGVAGGVFGVINRQMGIASYSPRLDSQGNSVRGIYACMALAEALGLHLFDVMNKGSSILDAYMKELS